MQNLDEAIRERAYHLWIADGRRDGKADAYWLSAQREILSTLTNEGGTTFAPLPLVEPVLSEAKYPAKKAKAAPVKKSRRRAA
jgi:hypothetical protein